MLKNFLIQPLYLGLMLCLVVQACAWLWQVKFQNTDIIDICWSLMIVVCGLIYYMSSEVIGFHSAIILTIPVLWYSRLTWHLILRFNLQHEDGRYKALRAHWRKSGAHVAQAKFFLFFLFQGFLAWLFSYPAYIISNLQESFSIFDLIGLVILLISFIGVTVSDRQLAHYKKNPANKGTVCTVGLWRYSRHPNYFFEWLHWFSYPLFGLSAANFFTLDGIILIASPFLMLLFLLKLTGIPFNEEQNIRSKGSRYQEYQRVTNMFFLGKPKPLEELS